MREYTLVIGGAPVPTAEHRDILNPSSGELVGRMPVATTAHLDDAVAAATRAFERWRLVPSAERSAACEAIAAKIEAHAPELSRLLTLEQGKPLAGLGSRYEIAGAVAWTRFTASLDLPVEVIAEGPDGRVELHRKPIGVVGSITPWNWPVMIACWHIVPAVRAGNTVVVKPSPNAPLSTIRLVELMNEVLPEGVVNLVSGDADVGGAMSTHAGIAKIAFTGSTPTGRAIMRHSASTLKRLTLELGGNDAGIVLPGADPDAIAPGLFWGAFINSGQTCACLKRLYVHDDAYDAVCRSLAAFARGVPMGDGLIETNELGPVQNRAQFDIVASLVEGARADGGRLLLGGEPGRGPGHFYPVTLVADVDNGTGLVDLEQFGPALPIIRYRTIDEAVTKANDTSMGLAGSVWGADDDLLRDVAQRMECGTVWFNRHGAVQPGVPFGGTKQSGIGVSFGADGLREFTTAQAIFC